MMAHGDSRTWEDGVEVPVIIGLGTVLVAMTVLLLYVLV